MPFTNNAFSFRKGSWWPAKFVHHYIDVIMTTMASQITSLAVVYSTVYSETDQRKHGLCVGNSPGPVNSPHKGPDTRKMFPFDDVIMRSLSWRSALIPWKLWSDVNLVEATPSFNSVRIFRVEADLIMFEDNLNIVVVPAGAWITNI